MCCVCVLWVFVCLCESKRKTERGRTCSQGYKKYAIFQYCSKTQFFRLFVAVAVEWQLAYITNEINCDRAKSLNFFVCVFVNKLDSVLLFPSLSFSHLVRVWVCCLFGCRALSYCCFTSPRSMCLYCVLFVFIPMCGWMLNFEFLSRAPNAEERMLHTHMQFEWIEKTGFELQYNRTNGFLCDFRQYAVYLCVFNVYINGQIRCLLYTSHMCCIWTGFWCIGPKSIALILSVSLSYSFFLSLHWKVVCGLVVIYSLAYFAFLGAIEEILFSTAQTHTLNVLFSFHPVLLYLLHRFVVVFVWLSTFLWLLIAEWRKTFDESQFDRMNVHLIVIDWLKWKIDHAATK